MLLVHTSIYRLIAELFMSLLLQRQRSQCNTSGTYGDCRHMSVATCGSTSYSKRSVEIKLERLSGELAKGKVTPFFQVYIKVTTTPCGMRLRPAVSCTCHKGCMLRSSSLTRRLVSTEVREIEQYAVTANELRADSRLSNVFVISMLAHRLGDMFARSRHTRWQPQNNMQHA
ncbi:unnamed protein product [Ceratitis capitata]|uniref:(Mediterranean fruit fly) hypothetical protein n=1 Tax=Ceratitis capitata TaxID=7213 RepID=A0A811V4V6_CERCA|nr:unnamed protein product [Ceratitis capitata]